MSKCYAVVTVKQNKTLTEFHVAGVAKTKEDALKFIENVKKLDKTSFYTIQEVIIISYMA